MQSVVQNLTNKIQICELHDTTTKKDDVSKLLYVQPYNQPEPTIHIYMSIVYNYYNTKLN